MGEQLIPFPEELRCNMCSTNLQCIKDCNHFYQLMLATIKAHDQAKKLQGSNNQLLQDLNPILEGQIKQLCDLVGTRKHVYNCNRHKITSLYNVYIYIHVLLSQL